MSATVSSTVWTKTQAGTSSSPPICRSPRTRPHENSSMTRSLGRLVRLQQNTASIAEVALPGIQGRDVVDFDTSFQQPASGQGGARPGSARAWPPSPGPAQGRSPAALARCRTSPNHVECHRSRHPRPSALPVASKSRRSTRTSSSERFVEASTTTRPRARRPRPPRRRTAEDCTRRCGKRQSVVGTKAAMIFPRMRLCLPRHHPDTSRGLSVPIT